VPDEIDADKGSDASPAGEPLSRWQRVAACALGLCGAGAGGASVFVTTNQAGSVALLGVGAGFLIMAVNGTPIIRAKLKDYELTMAPRRHKVVEQALSESPEEASKTLDVLRQIDPGARTDPAVRRATTRVYHEEVLEALTRVAADGSEFVISHLMTDFSFKVVTKSHSKAIDVSIKHTSVPDSTMPLGIVRSMYNRIHRHGTPLMVVTNGRLNNKIPDEAKTVDPEGRRIQFVRWIDRQDDGALRLAINRLLEASDEVAREKWIPSDSP
jgi:hypothetical protein